MTLKQGTPAPAFQLPHQPGEMIDLSEYLGKKKILLLFFPLSFSSVCTTEMCTMRNSWAQWEKLDAAIFGITVDSPFVTAKFRQEENIPFPVLSDFNKEVAKTYGVLYEEFHGFKGVPKRSAFVIGTDKKIHYAWSSDDSSIQPDYETLKTAVTQAP